MSRRLLICGACLGVVCTSLSGVAAWRTGAESGFCNALAGLDSLAAGELVAVTPKAVTQNASDNAPPASVPPERRAPSGGTGRCDDLTKQARGFRFLTLALGFVTGATGLASFLVRPR